MIRTLNVSDPAGNRVEVTVTRNVQAGSVTVVLEPITAVIKDKPEFMGKDGRVVATVPRSEYTKYLETLTNYLESLFLKELSDADLHTGPEKDNTRSRRSETLLPGGEEGPGGEKTGRVHNRRGGSVQTEGDRVRASDPEVDEVNDQETGGDGEERN